MVSFEKSLFINRPQQEVFDYLSDPANDSEWQSSTISSEWTSEGPPGVGSTLNQSIKFMGRKFESGSEVTAWDPPNHYAQKTTGGPIPFEVNLKFAAEENGTRVTVTGTAETGGFFKLAEGVVGKQLQKQVGSDFDNLKVVMEKG